MRKIVLPVVFALLTLVGCAPRPLPPPPPQFFDHTVQYTGETLALISSWYTNTSINWKEIAAANPGLKPNKLQIGTVVHIPSELVRQTAPLPARIVKVKPVEKKGAAPTATSTATPTSTATESANTESSSMPLDQPSSTQPSEPVAATPVAETQPTAAPAAPAAETAAPQPTAEQKEPAAATTSAPSVVVSTPAAASSEKVKEDLLDEILNQKKEGSQ